MIKPIFQKSLSEDDPRRAGLDERSAYGDRLSHLRRSKNVVSSTTTFPGCKENIRGGLAV